MIHAIENTMRLPLNASASLLESLARMLRSAAKAISLPELRFFGARTANPRPLGYWRCTHVDMMLAHHFEVGGIYHAEPMESTVSIRIIPKNHTCWAPYWDYGRDRFCYDPNMLDFEYLGPDLPQDAVCLSSEAVQA